MEKLRSDIHDFEKYPSALAYRCGGIGNLCFKGISHHIVSLVSNYKVNGRYVAKLVHLYTTKRLSNSGRVILNV